MAGESDPLSPAFLYISGVGTKPVASIAKIHITASPQVPAKATALAAGF
jgi:hypothetical protein